MTLYNEFNVFESILPVVNDKAEKNVNNVSINGSQDENFRQDLLFAIQLKKNSRDKSFKKMKTY